MPSKYTPEIRAKAVRLVREHRDEYDTEWAAMKAISARLGMNVETLRKWVRQDEVDSGQVLPVAVDEDVGVTSGGDGRGVRTAPLGVVSGAVVVVVTGSSSW